MIFPSPLLPISVKLAHSVKVLNFILIVFNFSIKIALSL